jgi:hypothetical protein
MIIQKIHIHNIPWICVKNQNKFSKSHSLYQYEYLGNQPETFMGCFADLLSEKYRHPKAA